MKNVLHIIPLDNIGGVEIAARSMDRTSYGKVAFRKYFLVCNPAIEMSLNTACGPISGVNNPLTYIAAARYVLDAKPDLAVFSLWRSAIVLILVKLLNPRLKCAVFLHLPTAAHLLDWIVNWLAMMLSTRIWADSPETLRMRIAKRHRHKGRTISYFPIRLPFQQRDPVPRFIFWGRLRDQKNLTRAVRLFSLIQQRYRNAHFSIIGPDGGEGARLIALVKELDLSENVLFLGEKSITEIVREASSGSFFLQTSKVEGMCLAVVEAMQLGLVPIVTPVGEIAKYCTAENSILIKNDESAVAAVFDLLDDLRKYRAMSCMAAKRWRNVELYSESVILASLEAIKNS